VCAKLSIFGEWRMLCDNAKSVQPPLLAPPKVVGSIQNGLIIYGCGAAALHILTFVNGSIHYFW